MSNQNKNIARIVRTLLAHQDKTRTDLAAKLGVHVSAVNKALTGHRRWTVDDVTAMAEFFGVNVALFFDDAKTLVKLTCFFTRRPRLALA